jgi:hypothetical protein
MDRTATREIYEAIAIAMQALEDEGEDLIGQEDAIVGESFRIVYNPARGWVLEGPER